MYSHNENKHYETNATSKAKSMYSYSLFRNLSLWLLIKRAHRHMPFECSRFSHLPTHVVMIFSILLHAEKKVAQECICKYRNGQFHAMLCYAIIVHACAFPLLRQFLARKFELWHKTVRALKPLANRSSKNRNFYSIDWNPLYSFKITINLLYKIQ